MPIARLNLTAQRVAVAMQVKEEQQRLLLEHKDALAFEAALMHKGIEGKDVTISLRHALAMLEELRTSSLTPKLYYDLFLAAQDHLAHLEGFLVSLAASGVSLADVFATVAYATHVVPRLYLQTAVASAFVRSGQSVAPPLLAELLAAAAGVQHPVRGLFARYYIVQRMRDCLPEAPPSDKLKPTLAGCVNDSLTFLLSCLSDMNRLWVRMGAVNAPGAAKILLPAGAAAVAALTVVREGGVSAAIAAAALTAAAAATTTAAPATASKGRKRRERERLELRILVGAVLTRISALEALSLPLYATIVLPAILREVADCADAAAQAYLVDSMLAVFPAEWHSATLHSLLSGVRDLMPHPVSGENEIKKNRSDRKNQSHLSEPRAQAKKQKSAARLGASRALGVSHLSRLTPPPPSRKP